MGKWNTPLNEQARRFYSNLYQKEVKYLCPETFTYLDKRTGRSVTVEWEYPSDGATGAIDIDSHAWWVHDVLCERGAWDDGTEVTNWTASRVLRRILLDEGFWFFANRWFVATWLLGGGKARENGMW